MDLQLVQLQTTSPIARKGSTCNLDETNYGPSCESRTDLQLGQLHKTMIPFACRGWTCNWDNNKKQDQLQVERGLATEMKKHVLSCDTGVDLQLGQLRAHL